MVTSLQVTVALGQPEVYDVDCFMFFSLSHHEVVRLDVSVNETLPVDLLEPSDDLSSYVKGRR